MTIAKWQEKILVDLVLFCTQKAAELERFNSPAQAALWREARLKIVDELFPAPRKPRYRWVTVGNPHHIALRRKRVAE